MPQDFNVSEARIKAFAEFLYQSRVHEPQFLILIYPGLYREEGTGELQERAFVSLVDNHMEGDDRILQTGTAGKGDIESAAVNLLEALEAQAAALMESQRSFESVVERITGKLDGRKNLTDVVNEHNKWLRKTKADNPNLSIKQYLVLLEKYYLDLEI